MTWLTRIVIPKRDVIARRFTDCYAWHQFAWMCFPTNADAKRDFLTRLDFLPSQESFRLYILSSRRTVRPSEILKEWWDSKEIASSFLNHTNYRFSLRANPTRIKTTGGRKIRLAILDRLGQLDWLQRKAEQGGFAFDPERIVINKAGDYRCSIRGNQTLHIGFDFEGELQVLDVLKFQQAFLSGIGKSKAFGFGLLLIFPILNSNE